MATLDLEMETYRRELPNLMAHEGQYVIIKGDHVLGTYDSYGDALKIGYAEYKLEPFLVKHISQTEQVSYFTRHIGAACRV